MRVLPAEYSLRKLIARATGGDHQVGSLLIFGEKDVKMPAVETEYIEVPHLFWQSTFSLLYCH